MGRPFKCPYEGCGSINTVCKGARKTKTMGIRRIRKCKACGRRFTPKNQLPEVEQQNAKSQDNGLIDLTEEEPIHDLGSRPDDDAAAESVEGERVTNYP